MPAIYQNYFQNISLSAHGTLIIYDDKGHDEQEGKVSRLLKCTLALPPHPPNEDSCRTKHNINGRVGHFSWKSFTVCVCVDFFEVYMLHKPKDPASEIKSTHTAMGNIFNLEISSHMKLVPLEP